VIAEEPTVRPVQTADRSPTGAASAATRRRREAFTRHRRRTAVRFLKFAVVGASGVPVTLAVNYLLHALLGLPLPLSTALAVETAIGTNFVGNNLWTFANAQARARSWPFLERHPWVGPLVTWALRPTVRRFVKFNAVSLVGLVITTVVTTVVASLYAAELRAMAGPAYFLAANLVGIAVATAWNFLANVVWTWY
jgi:dolichol-phosphate mannosyltransferase